MLRLLEAVCDEIGRNGLKKVILVVADEYVRSHGGNRFLASFFLHQIDVRSGKRLGRLQHLEPLQPGQETPVSWYANFPDHYAGDAHPATAEKGEQFLEYLAGRLVDAIKVVKADQVAPALYEEFFGRVQLPGVEKMCAHPGEKEKDRLEGLEKGLTRLGFRECQGADNSGPDGSGCAPAWQPEG